MASAKPAISKSKSKSKSSRSPPSHPPFHDMITDAIAAMKERNGSSQVAIRKFVEQKYGKRLPPNFRKNLILHLKRLVASGKLVKAKKSFKVPSGAHSSLRSSVRSKGSRSTKNTKAKARATRRKAKSARSPMSKKKKMKKKMKKK